MNTIRRDNENGVRKRGLTTISCVRALRGKVSVRGGVSPAVTRPEEVADFERKKREFEIEWQFSIASARTKLNRHYEQVHADNVRYKET
jgi:hypothetical protein